MSSKERKSYSEERFKKKRKREIKHQHLVFTAKIQNLLDIKYIAKDKSRTQQDIRILKLLAFDTPNLK